MTQLVHPLSWMVRKGGDCQDPHLQGKYAAINHTHDQYIQVGSVLENIEISSSGQLLYAKADHTHDEYLEVGEIAAKSYALNQTRDKTFSPKDHTHPEYQTL